MSSMHGFCFAPNKLYNVAYDFDGSTNYIKKTSNLTGIADSKVGFMSLFVYCSSTLRTIFNHFNGTLQNVAVSLTVANPPQISVILGDSTNQWVFTSTNTIAINTWHHIMISWDTNYIALSKVANIYNGDTDLGVTTISDTMGAVNVDYTSGSPVWSIGGNTGGGALFDGCLGQFTFYPGQTLDITNSTNRRKFSDSSFHPISIGRSGQTPTGIKPAIYLTSSVGSIGANSGSGGNFDSINGSFIACASGTP